MYLENIKEVIKEKLHIDLDADLSRKMDTVDARHIYCDVARQLNVFSYTEIGKEINRDHSSVIHSCKRSEVLKEWDKKYRDKFNMVFNNTIKPTIDEGIKDHYVFYKKMYNKYSELMKEAIEYNKNDVLIS